ATGPSSGTSPRSHASGAPRPRRPRVCSCGRICCRVASPSSSSIPSCARRSTTGSSRRRGATRTAGRRSSCCRRARGPRRRAAHLLLTSGANDEFTVSTLRAAATRSLAQGAPEVAAGYLARALDGAAGTERGEILVELGRAERWIEANRAADHLKAGLELLDD